MHKKQLIIPVIALSMFVVIVLFAQPRPGAANRAEVVFKGEIVSVSTPTGSFVLATKSGEQTISISTKTALLKGSSSLQLFELIPGEKAVAHCVKTVFGDELTAVRVSVAPAISKPR